MNLVERTAYRFGRPNVPNWKPPRRQPREVTNYAHLATPAFAELKLKHFVVSEVFRLADLASEVENTLACFWLPTRSSIDRIAAIAETVNRGSDLPLIVDIGTGNGLIPFLLAQTGRVRVAGIDPNPIHMANSRFSHPNLELACADAAWAAQKYQGYTSLVIQSWPPLGVDLSRFSRKVVAGAIINIFDPNCYRGNANKYCSLKGYQQQAFWQGPSSGELNLALLGRGSSFEGNRFNVFLRQGEELGIINESAPEAEYPWIVEARERFGAGFINEVSSAEKLRRT